MFNSKYFFKKFQKEIPERKKERKKILFRVDTD